MNLYYTTMIRDGASDEAPQFLKPLTTKFSFFCKFDLDAVAHDVSAAGLSAFNPVERRMTSLWHDTGGLILRMITSKVTWMSPTVKP